MRIHYLGSLDAVGDADAEDVAGEREEDEDGNQRDAKHPDQLQPLAGLRDRIGCEYKKIYGFGF